MPSVQGLEFAYVLYLLPPGRFPFHRWRWELWHGASMLAAGWRVSRPEAARTLGRYAGSAAHRMFGLRAPVESTAGVDFRPGATVRLATGAVDCVLVPRALAGDRAAVPAA